MNTHDDNINEIIYSLGNKYELYQNKWTTVARVLVDEYDIDMTTDAIRKRYKRYKRKIVKQQNVLHEMTKDDLVDLAETLLAEKVNQAAVREREANKSHVPEYKMLVPFAAENVLIIPDLQFPFAKKGWYDFICRTQDKYKCETVLSIGDVLDQHCLGRWVSDPDGFSAGHELEAVRTDVQRLNSISSNLRVCMGNHDTRHLSAAMKAGIPVKYLRHFNEILDVDWEWHWNFVQEGDNGRVLYTHANEVGGEHNVLTIAKKQSANVVGGHTHTTPGVSWRRNWFDVFFALNVGSLIDEATYALAYGIKNAYKCIDGCGVVLENGTVPIFERMF